MPKHPQVSPTADGLSDAVYTALKARAAAHPGPLYALNVGDTWREPLEAARVEALTTADHPGMHRYAPPHGLPDLLAAIRRKTQRRHGVTLRDADVQIQLGATAGLHISCQTLLNPGDEVLLPTPFWPLIRGIITSRGARAVQVPFYVHLDDPAFDPEAALEAAVTDRTVALYANTPNNPTGKVLSQDVLDAIARVAKRHDLWVLSDDVYQDIYFADDPPPALWTHPALAGRVLAHHSMSKSYGLAGARVGWTHGPEGVMRAIRGVQTYQTYCAPRPLQEASVRALDQGATWLAQTRDFYRAAGRAAAQTLGLPEPGGSTFFFFDARPWLPADATDALPFLERCLDEGVLLVPGAACGEGFETWVRLCFTSVPPADLTAALQGLAKVLEREP